MNEYETFPQLLVGFNMLWIGNNAIINRADFLTGWRFIMPYTFRTQIGVDHINLIAHRDSLVWAFRFAHIAIGTFVSD